MSTATALLHSTDELTFIGCDDQTEIVVFQTVSTHDANRVNTTALDTITGAIICDCKAAEFGRVCWHADHALAAWLRTGAMLDVLWLTDAELARYGTKLAGMVRIYRARTGRILLADQVNLVAARAEYRRRQAAALATVPIAVASTGAAPDRALAA